MTDEIDWGQEPRSETKPVKLNTMEMEKPHTLTITQMNMTDTGFIVCTIESETLEGNTLWLKGKYGLQNGALSLMNLVGSTSASDYIGETFTVVKEPSEKSMSGYRYTWTL